jgi:predicted RNase H-like nuclease
MMVTVAGVDGCRAGWVCVLRALEAPFCERAFLARSIGEVLDHTDRPAAIAIDIPIGLPERVTGAGRECDVAVRINLGKRSSAVFAVPARAVIAETNYRRACEVAQAYSDPPKQISKQMFHLFRKIREVDLAMTPELQNRAFECHPEAAFWAMNGRASLDEPKKVRNRLHTPGLERRRTLLSAEGFCPDFLSETKLPRAEASADDFLDACACAWTAARVYKGEAIRFPSSPPLDAKGLRMEILT